MPLDRTGNLPLAGRISIKTPETAIIFWIADHHQSIAGMRVDCLDQPVHERAACAVALKIRRDRNRANHDHGRFHPIRTVESHGPTLQRTNQRAIRIERRKRKVGDPGHAKADSVSGATVAVLPESRIKQPGNCRIFSSCQLADPCHRLPSAFQAGNSARGAGLSGSWPNEKGNSRL